MEVGERRRCRRQGPNKAGGREGGSKGGRERGRVDVLSRGK